MNDSYLMVHYGELSTKGDNKKIFIRCLYQNIRRALKKFEVETRYTRDHIYIYLLKDNLDEVIARLQDVSGIQKISLVEKCSLDLDTLKDIYENGMPKVSNTGYKVIDNLGFASVEEGVDAALKANADIEKEKKRAVNQIKDEISDIALAVAEKVVEKEIDPKDHERLIESFISELGE